VTAPLPAAEIKAAPLVFDLVVKGGKLVSGSPVVKAREGDEVTLTITSDTGDEVHLHGYDRHLPLKAGEAATLHIQATRTGRFPFELHKAHGELGTLEVYPR
jgi:hypothetical protein